MLASCSEVSQKGSLFSSTKPYVMIDRVEDKHSNNGRENNKYQLLDGVALVIRLVVER